MQNPDSDDIIESEARRVPSDDSHATAAVQQQSDADGQEGNARYMEGEIVPSQLIHKNLDKKGLSILSGDEFWNRVRRLLDGFRYPAWIENREGVIIFSNIKARIDTHLSGGSIGALIEGMDERGQILGVHVYNHLCGAANVKVKAYALPSFFMTDTKDKPGRLLIACCLDEENQVGEQLIASLLGQLVNRPAGVDEGPLQALTTRQKEIYKRLTANMSYKEIASDLGLAHSTVRVQVADIRKRLGVTIVPALRQSND
ncbi:hypothetical protein IMCC26134_09340 [Verrucomicrobia bacterium IMCC26134]|nr:hypothetical protein IMCC26134_09340 [Verrucomicrobia bacterium IMCC26134]